MSLSQSGLRQPRAGLRKRLCPVAPASAAAGGGAAPNFASHAAVSMALGFLFLGGGGRTFATDNASVAALVVSLFPRFPMSPIDQRCHLQARLMPYCWGAGRNSCSTLHGAVSI